MHVLIAYAGRMGTTAKAARLLADHFDEGATLRNLHDRIRADAQRYEAIVIGSAVYRGKIDQDVRKWLIQNEKALQGKKKGIFLCNAFVEETPEIIAANFPPALLDDCEVVMSFGGEIPKSGLTASDRSWIERRLKKRSKTSREDYMPCLQVDAIAAFAAQIQDLELIS